MRFGLNRIGIRGQKMEHKAMALEEEAKDNGTQGMATAFVNYRPGLGVAKNLTFRGENWNFRHLLF